MISYHFYATPTADETPEIQSFTFFDQADRFIATTRYVDAIRQRLSPSTRTTVNEIGSISADDGGQTRPGHVTKPIPDSYWNLSGAMYAYVFGNLAEMGIDAAGESQLVGYPTQFPSVSMVDWNTGAPNARFRVLELLKDNFAPGDKIAETSAHSRDIYALGMITPKGRKILVVNKRDREVEIELPQRATEVQFVDQTTKGGAIGKQELNSNKVAVRGLGVAVITVAGE